MVFLTEPVGHCFCPLAAGQKLLPTTVRNQLPLTATFLRLQPDDDDGDGLQVCWSAGGGFLEEAPAIPGSSSQVQPDPLHTFNLNSKIAAVSSFAERVGPVDGSTLAFSWAFRISSSFRRVKSSPVLGPDDLATTI